MGSLTNDASLGWVAFSILQIVGIFILGWFLKLMKDISKRFQEHEKRITEIEKALGIDMVNLGHYSDMLDKIDKKVDMILDPTFFERCPNINIKGGR